MEIFGRIAQVKKRYLILLITLACASFLCLYTTYLEWLLFLALFGIAFLVQLFGEKKKKRKELSILDGLREGVVVLDWEGNILNLNQRGCSFLKKDRRTLIHTPLFQHPLLEKGAPLLKRITESRIPQRVMLEKIDLELKVLEGGKKLLATFLDSTGEYQKKQLGKDFVANASHELRTPITIIKGFAETIYDIPEISEAMLTEFTEKIVRNCQRMDNLVKNLLTLADLDYLPKARLQEVDLVGLIDNCSHALLAIHPHAEIESFHNEEIILVNGDPDLLELAIMNLLENGVKYSQGSPFLTVTIADFGGWIELSIADKGIGIPPEDLEKIFDRFYTVDKAHSRRLGGAGLGLSIVNAIVSKHDAEISVTSRVGKGTTFILTFQPSMVHAP